MNWSQFVDAVLAVATSAGVGPILRACVVFLLALLAWRITMSAISATFNSAAARAEAPRRAAQLRSLRPLVRGAARAIVIVFAALLGASQFGIEIGPLIAGAGVVGIALGLGAQSLVKDYLTGFSLIIEDIASVGDVVRIGDSGGLVEAMTLRTIRLRDFDGTLHVIPYGEAQIVHNLTKTFSYYVFDLCVTYDSDIAEALDIMAAVGKEMQRSQDYADKILEPIEVVGVDRLAENGVMLKARIKTPPLQQWAVGREYNKRIMRAFDAAGVEMSVPHLKVLLPASADRELREPARRLS